MSTDTKHRVESEGAGAIARSEPVGRAQRNGTGRDPAEGPLVEELPARVRERLSDELIDELLAGVRSEQEVTGPGGLLADLTRRLVERAMNAELTDHLDYGRCQAPPGGAGNTRNGSTPKTLHTEHGSVPIRTPRDRQGSFEPQIVRKGQRRFAGLTRRSSRSTRAGCRCVTSKRISPSSMRCRSGMT